MVTRFSQIPNAAEPVASSKQPALARVNSRPPRPLAVPSVSMRLVIVAMMANATFVFVKPRVAIAWVVATPFVMRPIAVTIPVPVVMHANFDTGTDRDQPRLTICGLKW